MSSVHHVKRVHHSKASKKSNGFGKWLSADWLPLWFNLTSTSETSWSSVPQFLSHDQLINIPQLVGCYDFLIDLFSCTPLPWLPWVFFFLPSWLCVLIYDELLLCFCCSCHYCQGKWFLLLAPTFGHFHLSFEEACSSVAVSVTPLSPSPAPLASL